MVCLLKSTGWSAGCVTGRTGCGKQFTHRRSHRLSIKPLQAKQLIPAALAQRMVLDTHLPEFDPRQHSKNLRQHTLG
jgi:hypothetical protein